MIQASRTTQQTNNRNKIKERSSGCSQGRQIAPAFRGIRQNRTPTKAGGDSSGSATTKLVDGEQDKQRGVG